MTEGLVQYDREARGASSERVSAMSSIGLGLAMRHLLVPLDGSPLAERVLPYVISIARAMSARVTLLRVLDGGGPSVGRCVDAVEWEMARAQCHAYLSTIAARLAEEGIAAEMDFIPGDAAEQIVLRAKRESVDLIVLVSHTQNHSYAWNVGSTVQKVIEIAPTSMLVVPVEEPPAQPSGAARVRRILLPLDCSQRAECILPAATELARRLGAELLLAHVVQEPEMPRRMGPSKEDLALAQQLTERNRSAAARYLRDIQNRLAAASGRVQARLCVAAHPAQALRDLVRSEGVDLVIVSAHGSTGDAHQRYGSMVANFLHVLPGPVIILQDFAAIGCERRLSDLDSAVSPSR